MKTIFPLYSKKFKYIGLIIFFWGLILCLLKNNFSEIITYIGLFIIAYSKEPIEDDYTNHIRLESLKITFGLYIAWMIALNLTDSLTNFNLTPTPFLYIGLPLLLYNITFYFFVLKNKVTSKFLNKTK